MCDSANCKFYARRFCLLITMVLAVIFLASGTYEYTHDSEDKSVPYVLWLIGGVCVGIIVYICHKCRYVDTQTENPYYGI